MILKNLSRAIALSGALVLSGGGAALAADTNISNTGPSSNVTVTDTTTNTSNVTNDNDVDVININDIYIIVVGDVGRIGGRVGNGDS